MNRLTWAGGLLLGCQMPNPAFDDGRDIADDGSTDGTETESGESGSDGSGTTEDGTSSAEAGTSSTEDGTSETGEECAEGLTFCEQGCVDLAGDFFNCGECGNICQDGHVCANSGCEKARRMFVTSIPLSANANGIGNADGLCQLMAENGGFDAVFKAWLSTANSFPDQSFVKTGAFIRMDGAMVAKDWVDLTDGQLDVPINLTQAGLLLGGTEACGATGAVWTSTTTNGLYSGDPSCAGWTVANVGSSGQVGDAFSTGPEWTLIGGCPVNCAQPLPIYCVEQ